MSVYSSLRASHINHVRSFINIKCHQIWLQESLLGLHNRYGNSSNENSLAYSMRKIRYAKYDHETTRNERNNTIRQETLACSKLFVLSRVFRLRRTYAAKNTNWIRFHDLQKTKMTRRRRNSTFVLRALNSVKASKKFLIPIKCRRHGREYEKWIWKYDNFAEKKM